MKDINKLKNYRLKYKRYYGIDFSSDFAIHHIDLNHNNNDINNLLLLPKKLHTKYHFCLSALGCCNGKLEFNAKINICIEDGKNDFLIMLGETLNEIKKWKNYKLQLDMNMQNKKMTEVFNGKRI